MGVVKWMIVIAGVVVLAAAALYMRTGSRMEPMEANHASQSAPEPYPVSPTPPPADATTRKTAQ
jgi:hypothetical protein